MAGPGTELSTLLHRMGINAKDGQCRCKAHIREMDKKGCHWCSNNIGTIIDWLKTEATRRKLVFNRIIARNLVRLAIWRSRKKAAQEHP